MHKYKKTPSESPKKDRHIPSVSDEYWNSFNDMRKEHGETWQDIFERFHNYQQWIEHLFSLPKTASKMQMINNVTIVSYLPMWLNNFYENFLKDVVADIPDIRCIENTVAPGTPAIVVGAGPSVDDLDQLKLIKDSAFYKEKKGIIISTAHKLKDCLDAGVIPDYFTLIDGELIMIEFIDHDIVRDHLNDVTGILAAYVDHDVLDAWVGKKYFFMPIIPELSIPNVQGIMTRMFPDMTEFDACAHDGGFAWNVARYIGCNPIALIGLDLSFKMDTPVQKTPYYNAFRPSYKTEKDMMEACYRFHTHSFFGTNCYTDFCYDSFAESSLIMFKQYKNNKGIKTINCTGSGVLDDEAVENMWLQDWLAKWE